MASAKSTVYVMLGCSESKRMVTLRPWLCTRGGRPAGDTTTLVKASLTLTSSLKVSVMSVRVTLRAPGAGLARTR